MIKKINNLPIKKLLELGKKVCFTDYAIRFYYNKKHPKFHLNKEALKHAVRRAYSIGAFNHRDIIQNFISGE